MGFLKVSNVFITAFALLSCSVNALSGGPNTQQSVTEVSYIANYTGTDLPNIDSLNWIEIPDNSPFTRRSDGDHCSMISTIRVVTDSTGDWWSDWCRVDGMATHNRGDYIGVSNIQMKSTTLSAEISVSAPMGDSLKAKLGYSVTNSKGWAKSYGCTNQDGVGHGLWLQEHVGWGWQTITTDYTQAGPSWCHPAYPRNVQHVQLNWPDPYKTGSREFQFQCNWDLKGGRTCDFDNRKYL
ncbi:hypothetical protein VTL71DRAFT_13287 [Oculimacula yallundae]|uniref:Uncharacterized protein n=1 Tax=Oculimacula yallundae TaxID=86028 RepID=A0ABR4CM25_9HELO